MVKKAYLYLKNNKIHRGYEDHSLLSIFSEKLIVLGSNLIKRFRHKLKGSSTNSNISDVAIGVESGATHTKWETGLTSEASTLASSAKYKPDHK